MKNKLFGCITAIIMALSSVVAVPVMASSDVSTETESNSITICFDVTDTTTSETKQIDGAIFTIYKVADLLRNGNVAAGTYTLINEFAGTNINFDGMTAKESTDAAYQLAEIAKTSFGSATTDKDGKVSFTDISDGMYLVVETSASGTAADYTTVDPFLVAAPQFINDKWQATVTCNPKTEPVHKPVPEVPEVPGKPADSVNTGDDMDVRIYLGLFLCAATGIIFLTAAKKRRKEDNRDA